MVWKPAKEESVLHKDAVLDEEILTVTFRSHGEKVIYGFVIPALVRQRLAALQGSLNSHISRLGKFRDNERPCLQTKRNGGG